MLTADADPDIVRAYREQASLYLAAMWMLLRHDAGQAAALVALQAVRSAASYALASLTGRLTIDDREAREVADAADVFCVWALAVAPIVTEAASAPIQSTSN